MDAIAGKANFNMALLNGIVVNSGPICGPSKSAALLGDAGHSGVDGVELFFFAKIYHFINSLLEKYKILIKLTMDYKEIHL
jgi:hypothetical protein